MKWLVCILKGHDWESERVQLEHGKFIGIGLCRRCMSQYWVRGEVGKYKGVRIVKSEV